MSGVILIIEDEPDLVATLEYNLEREGYQTRSAYTGRGGLARALEEPYPALVLLDLMLPDISGNEVCRKLRADSRTAAMSIIMLTAKSEEIDRVVGFELGADDYMVKPFSVRELMLRVRAVLRRAVPAEAPTEELVCGRLRVDVAGHRTFIDENQIDLTALEFRLLSTLVERRGRVQSRDQLLTDVWGYHIDVTTRTVDTHVKRLREKLGPIEQYIETVRGVGYRFTSRPEGSDS